MIKYTATDEKWRRQFIVDLNDRWKLNEIQAEVAKCIFRDDKKLIVTQAGRKFGKTTTELYMLSRAAGSKWAGIFYWFAPRAKQAREIVWSSGRLQNFVKRKYIKKVLNTEMRIVFYNDSFIKLDGSDEYEQYRGVEVDGAAYDEMKDFDSRFHVAFRANLGPRHAFLLVAGTPPRNNVSPTEQAYFALADEARFREDGAFFTAPSWARKDPEWLEELAKIEAIYRHRAESGDDDAWNEWRCEFGGEYVQSGAGTIIPMFKEHKHVTPHETLIQSIRHKGLDLEYYVVADPGNNHPFAITFWALDRDLPAIYCLDEIYETNQTENTTGRIHPRILAKCEELCPDMSLWDFVYDEAALWFKAHVMASGQDPGWRATNKAAMRGARADEVKPYLDVLKDCIREDVVQLSDRCENFIREIKCYKRNEDGTIPKKGDDLIDTARYFLASANFTFYPKQERHEILQQRISAYNRNEEISVSMEKLTLSLPQMINWNLRGW